MRASVSITIVAAVLAASAVALTISEVKEEREMMTQLSDELEQQLTQKRAIVRDMDRYRVHIAAMKTPYEHLQKMLAPDFADASTRLGRFAVKMKLDALDDDKQWFALSGTTAKGLEAIVHMLPAFGVTHLTEMSLDTAGWNARGYALLGSEVPPADAITARILPMQRPWTARFSDEVWTRYEKLHAEIDELGGLANEIEGLTRVKKDMETKVAQIEAHRELLGAEEIIRDVIIESNARRAHVRAEDGKAVLLKFAGGAIRSKRDFERATAGYAISDFALEGGELKATLTRPTE